MERKQDFSPQIELDHHSRGELAQTMATPGFKVVHRICRAEVDAFVVDLINANPANKDDLFARHTLAKAAAAFYTAITKRMNEELLQYAGAHRTAEAPEDATESILDIGPKASTFADLHFSSFEEGME